MDFYYPRLVLEARRLRRERTKKVALVVLAVVAILGSGIAETSRIETMEATSAEATMQAMEIYGH